VNPETVFIAPGSGDLVGFIFLLFRDQFLLFLYKFQKQRVNDISAGITVQAHISALLFHPGDQLFVPSGQLPNQVKGQMLDE